jgi:hypothetical protein
MKGKFKKKDLVKKKVLVKAPKYFLLDRSENEHHSFASKARNRKEEY